MNIENIKAVIQTMHDALSHRSLCMLHWQGSLRGRESIATNMSDFHKCGNVACLAGHIALMPEFQADGGWVCSKGMPVMKGGHLGFQMSPEQTIATWLGIPPGIAFGLIMDVRNQKNLHVHRIYGVEWINVGPNHVISALEELMEFGVNAFNVKYFTAR